MRKFKALEDKATRTAKSTLNQFIWSRSPTQPIIKSGFSCFFRKITTIKTNDMPPTPTSTSGDSSIWTCQKVKTEAIESVKTLLSDHASQADVISIFSDGSFCPDKGGLGADFCPKLNSYSTLSLGNNSVISNHEAKAAWLIAVTKMASTLCRDWRIRRIVFFVDNKGVILRTMNPASPKRKPGQSLFNLIDESLSALPLTTEVFMAWCPGQRDILGNEVADELAREAVLHPTSSVFKIKSNLQKTSQMSLADLLTKCAKPSSLSFAAASISNQLCSGHCSLKSFLFWINRQLDPQCPFYPGRDTVSHLFNLCPHFKHIRSDLQKALQASKIRFKPNQLDRAMLIQKAYQPVANFLKLSSCFPSLDGPRLHQLKFTLP
ncbi:hypothetical protein PGT21_010596 [Puccinia graminis f. sp. tritici]|uniref:RNase H type-1 domain-containing protein n=1 Tax=Puccinia graminis f. sp. tritici TaxID=56615 RepID=A0A5B0PJ34_PUCGR|nr:hypothetical protein PGT21_010596 [Puccinia graminis f. sp. tritici]